MRLYTLIAHMGRSRKVVLTVLLSLFALLWFADEYPYLRFHGDAKFSGGPVFGYEIKMRPLPFNQPGEYVFHFRGIPNEDMSLLLYAQGKTDKNREELTHLDTTLDALLVDQTETLFVRLQEWRGKVKTNTSGF